MNFTKGEYSDLKKIAYETDEGYLFKNPNDPEMMIKVISTLPWVPGYFDLKLYTIRLLLENYHLLHDLRISLPFDLFLVDCKPKGYCAKCINGISLIKLLFNEGISLDTRIGYLRQVGSILRSMDYVRKTTNLKNFFYNDIHEDNFMVNQDGIVYGIDIDSCSIMDNVPSSSLYPSMLLSQISDNSKYKKCSRVSDYTSGIKPDSNLDLYCYIRMIINFMYGKIIDNLNKDNLFEYLDFLEFYGGNLELLYCLSNIYDDSVDNINPDYLLYYIKEMYSYGNIRYDKYKCLSKIMK